MLKGNEYTSAREAVVIKISCQTEQLCNRWHDAAIQAACSENRSYSDLAQFWETRVTISYIPIHKPKDYHKTLSLLKHVSITHIMP